jgi:hypothetical protein
VGQGKGKEVLYGVVVGNIESGQPSIAQKVLREPLNCEGRSEAAPITLPDSSLAAYNVPELSLWICNAARQSITFQHA